jgi:hypothetical protein
MANSAATKVTTQLRSKADTLVIVRSTQHPISLCHFLKPCQASIPVLTFTSADERDYGRERSRSPGPDRDGDARIRDEPMNGRADR